MKTVIGRDKVLAMALTLAALLLAGVLLWEWNEGMRLQRDLLKMKSIPAAAAKPLNILPEFALPTEEAGFPELISRSLFSVSRRSSAVAGNSGPTSMKKGQFVLVGVLITPQRSSAQLRDVQTSKAESVALNGVVRGMTVSEVGPSRVLLSQGAESEELILNVQTGPKAAIAARALAPPPLATPSPVAAPTPVAAVPATPASAPNAVAVPASAAGSPLLKQTAQPQTVLKKPQ